MYLLGQQNSIHWADNNVSFIFSNIQNDSVWSLYLDSEKAQSLISHVLMALKTWEFSFFFPPHSMIFLFSSFFIPNVEEYYLVASPLTEDLPSLSDIPKNF